MYIVVQTTTAQDHELLARRGAVRDEQPGPRLTSTAASSPASGRASPTSRRRSSRISSAVAATGGMFLEGHATPWPWARSFATSAEGSMLLSGTESRHPGGQPGRRAADFGLWTPADMDPAVSYAGWSNAQASSGRDVMEPQLRRVRPAPAGHRLGRRRAVEPAPPTSPSASPTRRCRRGIQQSLADVQVEKMPVRCPGRSRLQTWLPAPAGHRPVVKPTG